MAEIVQKICHFVRDVWVFFWRSLFIYGPLGAVTAQTWAITVAILVPDLLSFPLSPNVYKTTYLTGYWVGVLYGLYVKCRQMCGQGTQRPGNKKCDCGPRKCRCRRLCRKRNASSGRPCHRKRLRGS